MNLVMKSPRYYEVKQLSTDPNEICTTYLKLGIKVMLFMIIFGFSNIFFEKNTICNENYVYCVVNLPSPPPPSPFGWPLGWNYFWYS